MKLYAMPGTCALAPNIAAIWGSVDLEVVNLPRGAHREPDYLAINPKGQVPALVLDDGTVITEASAIMRYIAAQTSDAAINPADPVRWAAIDEALSYFTSEVHADFGGHFAPHRFATSDSGQAEVREMTYAKLRQHLVRIEGQLRVANAGHYLGTRSIADAYLYVILRWVDGTPIALADYPVLAAYRERIGSDSDIMTALKRQNME
jgi:glutathione S-transferase